MRILGEESGEGTMGCAGNQADYSVEVNFEFREVAGFAFCGFEAVVFLAELPVEVVGRL